MGVLKAKVAGNWVSTGVVTGPNAQNALGIVAMGTFKSGLVNPVAVTTTATAITEPIVITLLVGRRYRIVGQLRAVVGTAGATSLRMVTFDGAVDMGGPWGDTYCNAVSTAGAYDGIESGWILEGDGASHSLSIAVATTAGTAAAYFNQNCRFYIEDIGPNAAPALPLPPTPQAWTPVTFTSGWSDFGSGYQPVQYRKIGDVVYVRGFAAAAAGAGTVVFTLPVGFRSPADTIFTGWTATPQIASRIIVSAAGTVSIDIPRPIVHATIDFSYSVTP